MCIRDRPGVDGFLFDLGVSSPQLDIPGRGFSYNEDAPLDMRMDPGNNTLNAAEVINTYNEHDLARILRVYGEEKFASQIAREIVRRREQEPIETTGQFVEIIKAGIPAAARRHGGHPAKKSFQAIRIEVNHELDVLERGPVSYTHLDVYKRQAFASPNVASGILRASVPACSFKKCLRTRLLIDSSM